jgi:hypothetical protein
MISFSLQCELARGDARHECPLCARNSQICVFARNDDHTGVPRPSDASQVSLDLASERRRKRHKRTELEKYRDDEYAVSKLPFDILDDAVDVGFDVVTGV